MSSPELKRLAYSMLGSVADAEDVLQDAEVKLLQLPQPPDNADAFLFRVVTNLSLDRLRKLKRQRANYPGPWLPEPLTTPDPAEHVELAEQLSLGFVLMLERLTPGERVVFVLRQGFDFRFAEIAEVLEVSEATCRQRYRRAQSHLQGAKRFATPIAEQRQLLERLLAAVQTGEARNVVDLLSDTAVVLTDGGGVVSAAIAPVTDPQRIAQVTMFLAQKSAQEGELRFEYRNLNMGVGLLIYQAGSIHSCVLVDGDSGLIDRIYVVRNPHKLARLADVAEAVVS
ncbi:MAG: sigma-70 family RNA polymerase sigma factor [Gammaproteobacteria bacterium]|nr:sigma-70 family RNA polymerase sigma factor [Gammaproteobacteria bacterium]